MVTAKIEFAVQMTCESCVSDIKNSLRGVGEVEVFLEKELVVVHTNLPWSEVQSKIESTGKRAVLQGYGDTCAVAMINGASVKGVVRFVQIPPVSNICGVCIVDGTLDGLVPGKHGLHVHECGDISGGCTTVGEHYNPLGANHGPPNAGLQDRHIGDLGNVIADENGRATFRFTDQLIQVPDIIGRALVVTEKRDDYGKGDNAQSLIDGNSGERLACGIIARSAGLFQNNKKICACDGVTIWDERGQPLAGDGRGTKSAL